MSNTNAIYVMTVFLLRQEVRKLKTSQENIAAQ